MQSTELNKVYLSEFQFSTNAPYEFVHISMFAYMYLHKY